MAVDLFIKLDSDQANKIKSDWKSIHKGLREKYPIMEIDLDNGEITFDAVRKVDIDLRVDSIHFSTNAGLYDYMAYSAVALAETLGITQIQDPQSSADNMIPVDKIKSEIVNFEADYQLQKSNS